MKRIRSIRVKAIILLAVFSLNTLVGFACAIGVDMNSDSQHHHHDENPASPVAVSHHHLDEKDHHHHHEASANNKGSKEDDCCTDGVIKLSQVDKLLAQVVQAGIEMPVALVHLHFLYQSYLSSSPQTTEQILVVEPYVLSSYGIRVSIQSFRI